MSALIECRQRRPIHRHRCDFFKLGNITCDHPYTITIRFPQRPCLLRGTLQPQHHRSHRHHDRLHTHILTPTTRCRDRRCDRQTDIQRRRRRPRASRACCVCVCSTKTRPPWWSSSSSSSPLRPFVCFITRNLLKICIKKSKKCYPCFWPVTRHTGGTHGVIYSDGIITKSWLQKKHNIW